MSYGKIGVIWIAGPAIPFVQVARRRCADVETEGMGYASQQGTLLASDLEGRESQSQIFGDTCLDISRMFNFPRLSRWNSSSSKLTHPENISYGIQAPGPEKIDGKRCKTFVTGGSFVRYAKSNDPESLDICYHHRS